MSLKLRIILAILVSSIVSVALVSAPLYLGMQKLIAGGSDQQVSQMQVRFQEGLDSRIFTALSMAQTIAAIPRVQRAVEKGDTKGLHRLFVKEFAALEAATGVAQFQFHSPEAISILRVHNPKKHGDDLSAFRPMVVEANAGSMSLSGLERGRAGLGIRGIAPVTDDDEHLGTVEIGLRFDTALMNELIEGSDAQIEVYFLPDDSIEVFETADKTEVRITGNYDGPALLTPEQVAGVLNTQPARSTVELGGDVFAQAQFLINDYSGSPVAVANLLVPKGSAMTISKEMTNLAIGAAAVAVILSALMAWLLGARLTKALHRVTERMRTLAQGDTSVTLDSLKEGGEIGEMAAALTVFRDGLVEAETLRDEQFARQAAQEDVVKHLAKALRGLADGALDTRITRDLGDGYAQLVTDFNAAANGLNELISEIAGVAGAVTDRAKDLSESADDLSSRTENSASTLEQTASALKQVTSNLRTTTAGAQSANSAGESAIDKARAGADVVSETVQAMTAIDDSAEEIARIIDLIDDIAFQTNLLALNAGVEAARAGEAGSGFAVVASEVQALARRTADAAGQIGLLITSSGEKVKHGVHLVNRTGSALDDIVAAVDGVTEQISTIADLAQEQRQSLSEINVAVTELDQTTQKNAAMFQDTSAINTALLEQGEKLKGLVEKFRYDADIELINKDEAA
ncbi:methyl-accepting chemotaxis protein [Pacificoceanicola onchidii]|uniref:methyl-accepting chemotaxis protein n=1 Tax=Pacificoceanicola onchidii TaxID=2562685 RepID=UPI0010A3DCCB|nr:methyl-accepting chemotaxis protein [Pacificoceanicola onchidii]